MSVWWFFFWKLLLEYLPTSPLENQTQPSLKPSEWLNDWSLSQQLHRAITALCFYLNGKWGVPPLLNVKQHVAPGLDFPSFPLLSLISHICKVSSLRRSFFLVVRIQSGETTYCISRGRFAERDMARLTLHSRALGSRETFNKKWPTSVRNKYC